MKTLYLGPDELLVAAKVAFPKTTKVADVARAINEVEAEIRAAVPVARVIYIEPDIYQAPRRGRAVDRRDRDQGRATDHATPGNGVVKPGARPTATAQTTPIPFPT